MSSAETPLSINIASSAAAGIIARIFTHPLDTVKARLQAVYQDGQAIQRNTSSVRVDNVNSGLSHTTTTGRVLSKISYKGPVDVIRQTIKNEGVAGLYRGFPAVVIGGTPGTVLYLCSYEYVKKRYEEMYAQNENKTSHDFAIHFGAGMIAEAIACIVYVPVDVIKERMQVQHSGDRTLAYHNSFDALKQIMKNEGLSGIYKGYAATLGSFGPFSALYFVFYEKLKDWARQYSADSSTEYDNRRELEQSVNLQFSSILFCSATAGALASWITSPLDMAKLRLQVQRGSAQSPQVHFSGVWDCLRHAYSKGGVTALFRGAGARVLYFAPATTVTMTSFEVCKSYLQSQQTTAQP